VDEILSLSGKYPEQRSQIYSSAVKKAYDSDDFARARQIASDYPEQGQRRYMLEDVDRHEMWRSMNQEKMALLQQELIRLRSEEQRIQALLYVAAQVGVDDRKTAMGLLTQASQIIDLLKPGKAQVEGQIKLAMVYCWLKSDRGFTIMEAVIPKLNQLVAGAAAVDGFESNYLRDGEWNMTGAGVVGHMLTNLAQNAGYFAALDFDRSVLMADQFERPELRLMAESKIAQGVLMKQQNPSYMVLDMR
jgi:hypothetical protein